MGPTFARLEQRNGRKGPHRLAFHLVRFPIPFPTPEVYGVLLSMDHSRKFSQGGLLGLKDIIPLSPRRRRPFRRQRDVANAANAKPAENKNDSDGSKFFFPYLGAAASVRRNPRPSASRTLADGSTSAPSAALGASCCGDGCAPGTQSSSPRPGWPVTVRAQTPREVAGTNAKQPFGVGGRSSRCTV